MTVFFKGEVVFKREGEATRQMGTICNTGNQMDSRLRGNDEEEGLDKLAPTRCQAGRLTYGSLVKRDA